MLNFKEMPPGYSRARDVLRLIQLLVVGTIGMFLCLKYLPSTRFTICLLFVWIAIFSGASVFFGARALLSWAFRL
jgi:hypothetical protein